MLRARPRAPAGGVRPIGPRPGGPRPRGPSSGPAGPGPKAPPPPRGGGLLPNQPSAAVLPLLAIAALICWWGWKRGAYFDATFLPGAMLLLGLLAALLLYAPLPARIRGPAAVALGSLLALAAWTLISALWSPAPDIAARDAQRVFSYAVAFALGLWLCVLLGRRMLLALAPLAGAGAAVAVATLIALWIGDDSAELLEIDGTIRFPLGYRNAVAAFFMASVWPMVVLAASRDLDWRLRGALVAAATLAIELTVLTQSRGTVFATAVALAVLVAVHPSRLRILGWVGLAAAPVLPALPWLLDVFQAEGGNTAASLPSLRSACGAMAVTSLASFALGCAFGRSDDRIRLSPAASRAIGIGLAGLAAVAVLAGVVKLATAEGGPTGYFNRQADELTAGTPDLTESGSRFGLDLRSDRGDLWRVALDDFAGAPLSGEGAGGWRYSYLLDRESSLQPEDPHSVEMLMAGELGLPGLALFVAFCVAAVLAALRSRRLGPAAAALSAGALAAAAYWLVHASVEWFWTYPGITLPMAFAVGAAAGPALLRPAQPQNRRARVGLALAAVAAAAAFVPFFLSERYTNNALRNWREDVTAAYSDLERAADLNPLSDRAYAAQAVIAESAGEPQRALAALSRAQERRPDEWTLYFLEARVLAPIDPAGAARAIERARALNPEGREIDDLEAEIGQAP